LQRLGSAKKIEKTKKIQELENENPPNVRQARLIENFSEYFCQQVYEGEWEAKAKSEAQMIRRMRAKIK
jgi:hypothetical protein